MELRVCILTKSKLPATLRGGTRQASRSSLLPFSAPSEHIPPTPEPERKSGDHVVDRVSDRAAITLGAWMGQSRAKDLVLQKPKNLVRGATYVHNAIFAAKDVWVWPVLQEKAALGHMGPAGRRAGYPCRLRPRFDENTSTQADKCGSQTSSQSMCRRTVRTSGLANTDITSLTELTFSTPIQGNDSNDRELRGERVHYRNTIIGRTVIDENDLEPVVQLHRDTADCTIQRSRHIIVAHAN